MVCHFFFRRIFALVVLLLWSISAPASARAPSSCRLKFLGAAGNVTGSMHLLEAQGRKLLVDCGMAQGRDRRLPTYRSLPTEATRADAMILTHAHIDHSGNVPLLVKEGFTGDIHCTKATADLCRVMLMDSARIQEKRAKDHNLKNRRLPGYRPMEPTYTVRDAEAALCRLRPHAYGEEFSPLPGIKACFYDAGHVLGSASVAVDTKINGQQRRIAFSGDIGRRDPKFLKKPQVPGRPDYVVMESTYGDRTHASTNDMKQQLLQTVLETQARGGKVIIPSFAFQRTQEIVYTLNQLYREGRLNIPVYLDSPLGSKLTQVFRRHPMQQGDSVREFSRNHGDPLDFPSLRLVRSTAESRQLNSLRGPAVIIASSGMCTAGRIQHHLRHSLGDSRNTVAVVGYQASGTLGRELVEGSTTVQLHGRARPVRAQVRVLDAFSAHGDKNDLAWWARSCGPQVKQFFLVHGEPDACRALRQSLARQGCNATIPTIEQSVDLTP